MVFSGHWAKISTALALGVVTAGAAGARVYTVTLSGEGSLTNVSFETGCDPEFRPGVCGETPSLVIGQPVSFSLTAQVERDPRTGEVLESFATANVGDLVFNAAGFVEFGLGWSPRFADLLADNNADSCAAGDAVSVFGRSFSFAGVRCGFLEDIYPITEFSGGGRITSITVNGIAVPEAATWAMMIAGFGLIGGALRRRRAAAAAA